MACLINVWTVRLFGKSLFSRISSSTISAVNAVLWVFDLCLILSGTSLLIRDLRIRKGVFALTWLTGLNLFLLATNPVFAGHFMFLRIGLVLVIMVTALNAFYHLVIKNDRAGSFIRNLGTGLFTLTLLFLLLEGAFMFIPRSHRINDSLASKMWFAKYWHTNELGYRDKEFVEKSGGKKRILLLGDSFAAGHGIKKSSDRFGNLLEAKLGEDHEVYNLGVNGSYPDDELDRFRMFPFKADQLVLCWFVNDIHVASEKSGEPFIGLKNKSRRNVISLLHGSYFVNYLYWSFSHEKEPEAYLEFLKAAFVNNKIMHVHREEIIRIAIMARKKRMKFSVALFPMMEDVKGSAFAIGPMKKMLDDLGVKYCDLQPALEQYKSSELIVNKMDAHPNEFAQKIIAEELYQFMTAEVLSDSI